MSLNLKTRIVTATPYNVVNSDDVIFVNVAGAATVVLPATGNDGSEKRSFYIKDFSGLAQTNTITISSAGGKTIDGVSFALLNSGFSHIHVVYDGNDWKIIA